MALLETHGLTARYGDFKALFGIDFAIEAGETVAIIGANGAGKSTPRPGRRPGTQRPPPEPTGRSEPVALRWATWSDADSDAPDTSRRWPSWVGPPSARSDPDTTAASFGEALAAGVNHLDVAPQYGLAQELLGPLIPPVRDRLFVACKTLRHRPDGVRAQLEESLRLLGCDSFDLYQLHAVTDLAELDARDGQPGPSWRRGTRASPGGWGSPGTNTPHRRPTSRHSGATTSTP